MPALRQGDKRQNLCKGVKEEFSHAEIIFEEKDLAFRLDSFFEQQINTSLVKFNDIVFTEDLNYQGTVYESLDGILKEVNFRSFIRKAVIILTIGKKPVDCIVNSLRVPDLGDNFDKRVIIEGVSHYNASSKLPIRFDIKRIIAIKPNPDGVYPPDAGQAKLSNCFQLVKLTALRQGDNPHPDLVRWRGQFDNKNNHDALEW